MTQKKIKLKPKARWSIAALLQRVLFGELRLKREGRQLQVTWGDTLLHHPDETTPPAPASKLAKAPTAGESMHALLKAALDAKPTHRKAFQHLIVFEAALARFGAQALDELPASVLIKAHDQLELLASLMNADEGLLQLTGDMSDAIARRTGRKVSMVVPSNLAMSAHLEISDGRLSDFMSVSDDRPALEASSKK